MQVTAGEGGRARVNQEEMGEERMWGTGRVAGDAVMT